MKKKLFKLYLRRFDGFLKVSYFDPCKITRENIKKAMIMVANRYSKGSLVDLGCGVKPYEPLFKDGVSSYYGVDFLTTAEVNYGERTQADLLADCADTKLPSESYDTVLSTQVIEHVYDTDKYISEIHRLLKKDGNAIITAPLMWQCHAVPYDYHRFTRYSLEKIFKDKGFEILEITELEGAFAAVIQMIIVSVYGNCENQHVLIRYFRRAQRVFWVPILNYLALHLDNTFLNKKLCLNYLVVAKKL